eukprot:3887017-Rhodomonas_salina.3
METLRTFLRLIPSTACRTLSTDASALKPCTASIPIRFAFFSARSSFCTAARDEEGKSEAGRSARRSVA